MPHHRFVSAACRPIAALLVGICLSGPATAEPPVVDAIAEAQAGQIRAMTDSEPVGRMNQLLASLDLSDAALFALASTHPGLSEQLKDDRYRLGVDYLATLPAHDLGRIRRGETIIRTADEIRGSEEDQAVALCEYFGFKTKNFVAIRVGPFEGRIYRVEVTATGKKKTQQSGTIELAWPSTPKRDEQSRENLAKIFGARPSRTSMGAGALIPILDGSFEEADTLTTSWQLDDGAVLGTRTPTQEVVLDNAQAIDGLQSLRFYAEERTRLFYEVAQQVTIAPTTRVRAKAQHRTHDLRREFQQAPDAIWLKMSFLDMSGNPVIAPIIDRGSTETHTWQELAVEGQAPAGTAYVRIAVFSGLSGTAWFDGVTVEIAQ